MYVRSLRERAGARAEEVAEFVDKGRKFESNESDERELRERDEFRDEFKDEVRRERVRDNMFCMFCM